jgi:hypothetical protein
MARAGAQQGFGRQLAHLQRHRAVPQRRQAFAEQLQQAPGRRRGGRASAQQ